MYNFTIEKISYLLTDLDFTDIQFDYAEFNEWFFNASTEDNSKVIICFNTYYHDIDFAYRKAKSTFYNIGNLNRLVSIRPSIKKILLNEDHSGFPELGQPFPNNSVPNSENLNSTIADIPFDFEQFEPSSTPTVADIQFNLDQFEPSPSTTPVENLTPLFFEFDKFDRLTDSIETKETSPSETKPILRRKRRSSAI